MIKNLFLFITIIQITLMSCNGQIDKEFLLWPEKAPFSKGDSAKDKPTITAFTISTNTSKPAVLICPGGSYTHLAFEKEGTKLAEWFNSQGYQAFVLKYRLNNSSLTGYTHPAQLEDAGRAIRWIKANANKYNIDTSKIGVMGFSAGGHLASTIATHHNKYKFTYTDSIDKHSSRPDFVILIYPVITMQEAYCHKNSRKMLTGNDLSPEKISLLSNELQIDSLTPQTFIVHADDDKGVVPENSILFYVALKQHKIPAELHIYKHGGHGFGMAPNKPELNQWLNALKIWLSFIN
jgi:acetyl esterase/lipase